MRAIQSILTLFFLFFFSALAIQHLHSIKWFYAGRDSGPLGLGRGEVGYCVLFVFSPERRISIIINLCRLPGAV